MTSKVQAIAPSTSDQAMRRQASEQTTLFNLTDRLYRASTMDEVYDAAFDALYDALGCSRAAILRFDRGNIMRFAAFRSLSANYRAAVDGHSPWSRTDHDAQPILIGDVSNSHLPDHLKQAIRREGIHALIFVPLAGAHELMGKFMAYYDMPRVFSPGEEKLAVLIARQLGFAIERQIADRASRRLAALIESSHDAIIAKDLDGIITDWNPGAQRLFGYRADEVIGQSIMLLIPPDRQDEEPTILARIRAGERVDHYETVRRRKDGSLVDISLTVSPIKDGTGRIIGASKIARDISDRRRAREQRELLLREMNHRVKNLFALASSIVNLSAGEAATPAALASRVGERLAALARAHELTMAPEAGGRSQDRTSIGLHDLIAAILAPYAGDDRSARFAISGYDRPIPARLITPLSLLLHEFATNAAKYGSFSVPQGLVDVSCGEVRGGVALRWREVDGPAVAENRSESGFGSRLIAAAARQLGRLDRRWHADGVAIDLFIEADRLRE